MIASFVSAQHCEAAPWVFYPQPRYALMALTNFSQLHCFVGQVAPNGLHHSAIVSNIGYRLFPNASDKCLLNGFLKVENKFLLA
jgi:hypothetical protein